MYWNKEGCEDFFLMRKQKRNSEFEWTVENRKKIVEKSDAIMREIACIVEEAKRQEAILEKRLANGDSFMNDYEIECEILFAYWDIFEDYDEEDSVAEVFFKKQSTLSFSIDKPVYLDRELNWNIEVFPEDWDKNMYVLYAVHELCCHNIWSLQDFLKISEFYSEVNMRIQKNRQPL